MTALERAEQQLADIRAQQKRQSEFVGERLGVIARLRALDRDEQLVVKRIERMRAATPVLKDEGTE